MARLVKTTVTSDILCNVVTSFEDGSSDTRQIKAGDILEDGIRYVQSNQTKTVVGRVTVIGTVMPSKPSNINLNDPVDNFANDVKIGSITVDKSEQYKASTVSVPGREVVENEGVENVTSVHCVAYPKVTLTMSYTDGSSVDHVLEVGNVLKYVKIMDKPGKPDIEGSFKIMAFGYTQNNNRPKFDSVILKDATAPAKAIRVYFDKILSFEDIPSVEVTAPNSLSAISTALKNSESGKVSASLGTDVTIPLNASGKIVTLMVNKGQELDFDLNGHNLNTQAYALYVNGGTLNIYDSTGDGKINAVKAGVANPAIFVAADGVCNMEGGTIDTTGVDTSEGSNWLYGVACSGNGVFNMNSGKMIIGGAAGISITNGTASGEGAKFTIGGDAVIKSLNNASVYLADNKSVIIKDKATLYSSIVARMGDITIQDNATVNSLTDASKPMNLGSQACVSGVGPTKAAITALTGCYGSSLGNDMNIVIKDNAKLVGAIDDAIDIAEINTKYDQVVNVTIENSKNVKFASGADNAELAELAKQDGRTLPAEKTSTTLTITIDGEVVDLTKKSVDDDVDEEFDDNKTQDDRPVDDEF